MKAKIPGNTVGKFDEAVEYVFGKLDARPKYVVTIVNHMSGVGSKTARHWGADRKDEGQPQSRRP